MAPARRDLLRLGGLGVIGLLAVAYALHARPDTGRAQRGPADPGTPACEVLTAKLAKSFIPRAKREHFGEDDPDYCDYGGDRGATYRSVGLYLDAVERARATRTTEPQGLDEMFPTLLQETLENGDGTAAPAPALGDGGQMATDVNGTKVTGLWKRGGTIYKLSYFGWGSSVEHAQAKLTQLAQALPPAA